MCIEKRRGVWFCVQKLRHTSGTYAVRFLPKTRCAEC